MSVESRVVDLEMRVAFQDDALNTMSHELAQQQRTIEKLQAQIASLLKRQEELVERVDAGGGVEPPPPHY
ncbi:SlyX family protein [Pseudomonas matsuisoli]|uniref:Protein SlyX homolog n=1 Tax=Pseudomonas matsuisoli TaxID=1515666 RepID=A0A917URZ7_9PSED|nr:SlyX family protein [Pseudomonas matsuisoli]GGJ81057.1 protein SlyX [Pseudomonas matsuisoli]